ncbi:Predicted arabinose efflux permease, MFS family [Pseudonocardia thermophila]|jgi:Arabinose efflux permease|uniref:Predicted arabinose efflux permease, MFS family n=1 Tax=Pseudonocardia thermophila TaxID=1848 RepID=A0A1M6UI92_PSETH|nr:MFS transporter [Pseudonocardia thermophila]SHK68965.1 Predicted arabinose efflux permease, MFS family [Pseudonocardia thermophila]
MTATADTPQAIGTNETVHETRTSLFRDMFASLANPNYRLYISGQAVSLAGTWMQTIAQSWLVLELTGSATAVGAVVALQTLPTLLLGPYAGVVADRVDKRRFMIGLQSAMGVLALTLGLLVVTGLVQLWHVFALALLLGLNNCFEQPVRQAFVLEMVGPQYLRNAVSLNSVLANAARAVGPAIAGVVIATGGIGLCFLINAATFVAVVVSLVKLDTSALMPSVPAPRAPGQLREGLRYVAREPMLAVPLLMMALVGCLTYEFQVVLPVVAQETFAGDASAYGFLTAAMGAGAVVGGLFVAARGRTGLQPLIVTALGFGAAMGLVAVAPTLPVALAGMALVGATSVAFMSTGNSTLQLTAAPTMRGRVMALWAVAFLGSTPIGGPIAGAVSQAWGGRAGLAMGAVACLVSALMGLAVLRRGRARAEVPTAS